MSANNREDGYKELLANIRRLTILVLDDLEEGSRERTLDQAQKRLLSSTGTRLLRLWRTVLREGGSDKTIEELNRIAGVVEKTTEPNRDGSTDPSGTTTSSG